MGMATAAWLRATVEGFWEVQVEMRGPGPGHTVSECPGGNRTGCRDVGPAGELGLLS